METSGGKHTENLMTLIPLSVFVFIVILALGGPAEFVRTVGNWVGDVVTVFLTGLKEL